MYLAGRAYSLIYVRPAVKRESRAYPGPRSSDLQGYPLVGVKLKGGPSRSRRRPHIFCSNLYYTPRKHDILQFLRSASAGQILGGSNKITSNPGERRINH